MPPKKSGESSLPSAPDSVELRLRRLEEAVAGLQDTRQMEERVVERVSERLSRNPPDGAHESKSLLMNVGRSILPGALGLASDSDDDSFHPRSQTSVPPRRAWWLFEAYDDLRAVMRMYSDHRYRRHMTWTAFLTPFVFLLCLLLVWFWMPTSIPVLGVGLAFLDKVIDLLLAFFAYKILTQELIRYREMMAGHSR
jgi:hypothetical protein